MAVDDERGAGHAAGSRRRRGRGPRPWRRVVTRPSASSARPRPAGPARTGAARCPGRPARSRPPSSRPSRWAPTRRRPALGRRRHGQPDVVVALGDRRDRSAAVPRASWRDRSPATSHHAAGLPPPPSIVVAHSMPTRASSAGPPRCSSSTLEREGGSAPVAAERQRRVTPRPSDVADPSPSRRATSRPGAELDELERAVDGVAELGRRGPSPSPRP